MHLFSSIFSRLLSFYFYNIYNMPGLAPPVILRATVLK